MKLFLAMCIFVLQLSACELYGVYKGSAVIDGLKQDLEIKIDDDYDLDDEDYPIYTGTIVYSDENGYGKADIKITMKNRRLKEYNSKIKDTSKEQDYWFDEGGYYNISVSDECDAISGVWVDTKKENQSVGTFSVVSVEE